MAKSKHYVNNAALLECLIEWKKNCAAAEKAKQPKPKVPEYIGECLLKIANRLSTKPNFINYTYRDEMISDGIENCINYIDNFNPEKSNNPFAYFTQIIYYAYLRRIQKQKKQLYIKHKTLERSVIYDDLVSEGSGESQGGAIHLENEYMKQFVQDFENKEAEKKEKRIQAREEKKAEGIENFIDNEDSTNN